MKALTDAQVRQILNTLDQVAKRLGQSAYDGRLPDGPLCRQIADAVRSVQQILVSIPTTKETQ